MAPPEGYSVRLAARSDVALIARHRAEMFRDMGEVTEDEARELQLQAEPWLDSLFAAGAYRGWIIEREGEPVCGGGVWLREIGPVPGCLRRGRWAHVVNVYTEPAHRRHGLARALMREILAWCAANADLVTLAASVDGRPLYEELGFASTNEMRLKKPPQD